MRVYHYAPADHALSGISLRRLKISRLSDLNDPFELAAVNLGSRKSLRGAVRALKDTLDLSRGLLCFSKTWHNPVMWSHYASRHRGVCMGFDLRDDLGKDVAYASKRLLSKVGDGPDIQPDEALAAGLLYTKYAHWSYEQEHRVFVSLDKDAAEGGLYFYDFSEDLRLREVILGPLCDIPVQPVRNLVAKVYDHEIYVTKSRLAFKSFSVVEDRRFRAKSSNKSLERSRER